MGDGHHLRKVDHCHLVFIIEQQIELVEVAVNQAVAGQTDNQLH